MRVEIVTPEALVTSLQQAEHVMLPGQDGQFGVLPQHMPLIAMLQEGGSVRVDLPGGASNTFTVGKGFAEITGESVTILVDSVSQQEAA
jgi:F-type H+-transporting ATPase subunit epsilon